MTGITARSTKAQLYSHIELLRTQLDELRMNNRDLAERLSTKAQVPRTGRARYRRIDNCVFISIVQGTTRYDLCDPIDGRIRIFERAAEAYALCLKINASPTLNLQNWSVS